MTDEICNIFISHIHKDDQRLGPLKELLARNGCQARDSSIKSSNPNRATDPDYIMREILKPRIDWAGAVVVLISPETKDSGWVNKEIEYAMQKGKRVIGVWDHGEKGCELPSRLDEHGVVVAWRADQIIDAIFGRIDDWRSPKGDPISPRDIPHYRC